MEKSIRDVNGNSVLLFDGTNWVGFRNIRFLFHEVLNWLFDATMQWIFKWVFDFVAEIRKHMADGIGSEFAINLNQTLPTV